ncbi:MAG: hypothetical protein ABI369_09280 [Acetobacteraceae bacterium]
MSRGSLPGERRGGRQKGTPNKATLSVMEKLTAIGCDPIAGMARLASDETNAPELRGRMYAELAGYVAPKRKAIEHTGADGGPIATEETTTLDLSALTTEQLRTLCGLIALAGGGQ